MTDLKQKVKDFAEVHIKPFSRPPGYALNYMYKCC